MKLECVDKKILKYLNYDNGFFIEVGANNGIIQSNTYILEKDHNWKGILIEPSLSVFYDCKKIRINSSCYNCALVSDEYDEEYISGDFNGHLMSSVDGKRLNSDVNVEVKARTLTSILDENDIDKIDFFSLDVEGYELEVLKGLNFEKYQPIYILVEIYEKDKVDIINYLEDNNYDLVCNLSDFNLDNNPYWDGTHNDYLFKYI